MILQEFKSKNLSVEEQVELIKKYRETGNLKYKEDIILANVKLINKFVLDYCPDNNLKDDCFSIGLLVISKAIDMFNIENTHGATFTTYISKGIKHGIWRFVNNHNKKSADLSLDEPIGYQDTSGDPIYLKDLLADESLEYQYTYIENLETIYYFMNKYFSPRTLELFRYKFGLDNYPKLKDKQIGIVLNMSRSNVGNHYSKGIKAIRKYLNENIKPRRKI